MKTKTKTKTVTAIVLAASASLGSPSRALETFDVTDTNGVTFMTTIDDSVNSRIKKWQSERQSKLFGGDIPDPIFTFGQSGS